MIFSSAGHNSKSTTVKKDPGAVNKDGIKEGDLTIEFRDLVNRELNAKGANYIADSDNETLGMYLKRIKTGRGSVVLEYHFDSAASPLRSGCTSIIANNANVLSKAFGLELAQIVSTTLKIKNNGVIPESRTFVGRLGLMRKEGIVCLIELGFLSNPSDLCAYHAGKLELAKKTANLLIKFDKLI